MGRLICLIVATALLGPVIARGIEQPAAASPAAPALSTEKFDEQSLALRTTLFHEPTLETPLEKLIGLYRDANRVDELVGLYRTHVAQYPEDAGSQAVLIRILQALNRPESAAVAQSAAQAHPENGLIIYLRHLELDRQRDPRALDLLAEAIARETNPSRQRAWVEKLVTTAVAEDRRDLAEAQLRLLVRAPGQSAENLVSLSRRLTRDRFHALALEAAELAATRQPSAETSVDIEMEAAAAETGLGRGSDAARRLDALLRKVAPDYARRPEIVQRRVALVRTDAEREKMLATARAAWAAAPASESAALECSELLSASGRRREALQVLREAGKALPESERVERATLALMERLGDERELAAFLGERIDRQPDRVDLEYRLIKALHALGQRDEAARRFHAIIEKTPPADRFARQLDFARALRRMNLPGPAADVLRKALESEPRRLDVRRELAESLVAAGDQDAARALMKEGIDPGAAIEDFLDFAGFMVARDMLPEARAAFEARLVREPRQFEIALRLVDVLARLGEQKDGESRIEAARAIADTPARYRRWLESAVAFHDAFDTVDGFFESEQARLVTEATGEDGWTPDRASRYLTLCDVTRQSRIEPRLIEALKNRLEDAALPASLRIPLHRMFVDALARDPKNAIEVRTHLEQLAGEDALRAAEYRLRLARAGHDALQQSGGRSEDVRELLESIKIADIRDPIHLRGADKLFLTYGFPEKAFDVLEQLTVLEPGERGNWERWMGSLAAMGDEDRLRAALRQVLAGATGVKLSEETNQLLRSHIVDSCWRSVAALLAGDNADQLAEALPLLDAIERVEKPGAEQLWVAWARGWTLRRLGREEESREAAGEFERLAGEFLRRNEESDATPALVFPDGLTMSVAQALALIREGGRAVARPADDAQGPSNPPRMRWGFQTDHGAIVVQVLPSRDGAVFVIDDAATLYKLDQRTGKILWRESNLWKTRVTPGPTDLPRAGRRASSVTYGRGYYGNPVQNLVVAARAAFDDAGGRLFVCHDGELSARAATDGAVLWRAEIGGQLRRAAPAPGQPAPPPLTDEVFLDPDGRVIVWRGETATAAAYHPETGKLLWSAECATTIPNPLLHALNSGSACADGLLLVYGHRPGIIETASGATRWRFDAQDAREFPIALRTEDDITPAALPPPPMPARRSRAAVPPPAPRRLALNHLKPLEERAAILSHWMENSGALVAPAVSWAEQGWQPVGGTIAGGRLILSMPQLTMGLSLDLPLGGTRFDFFGTFIGAAGARAVFQVEGALAILDLTRGTLARVPLGIAAEGGRNAAPEVCVGGGRVYAAGARGMLCLNAHTGRVLYSAEWPEPVKSFAGLAGDENVNAPGPVAALIPADGESARAIQYHPRFIVQPSVPPMSIALFPRSVAHGDTLFAVLAPDRVAALESPPPAEEK